MAIKNLGIFTVVVIATILAQATLVPAAGQLNLPGPGAAANCGNCGGQPVEYIVGDCKGWGLGVDYIAWARDKTFYVGDKLIFNYDKSKHNVAQAEEPQINMCCTKKVTDFPACGSNRITLGGMGGLGFMSTKGDDCTKGMKFYIEDVKCPALRPKA